MRKQIRVVLFVVSISTCAAVLTLWMRSEILLDAVFWKKGSAAAFIALCDAHSTHGNLSCGSQIFFFSGPPLPRGTVLKFDVPWGHGWYHGKSSWNGVVGTSWLNRRGFHFSCERTSTPTGLGLTLVSIKISIGIPHWFALACSAAPLWWLRRTARRNTPHGFPMSPSKFLSAPCASQ